MARTHKHKRRIKLIKPGLQLRLTAVVVGFGALALMLQTLLFLSAVTRIATRLPHDGDLALEVMLGELWSSFGLALALGTPTLVAVGILATFRFAGPVFRLERFLRQVIAGEQPEDCRLRKGDELHEFCGLINEATRPLRERPVEGLEQDAGQEQDQVSSGSRRKAG